MINIQKNNINSIHKYVYCSVLSLLLACGGVFIGNHYSAHASNNSVWKSNGISYYGNNNTNPNNSQPSSDVANNLLNSLLSHPNAQSNATNSNFSNQQLSQSSNSSNNYIPKINRVPKKHRGTPFVHLSHIKHYMNNTPKISNVNTNLATTHISHHSHHQSNGLTHYDVKQLGRVADSKLGDKYAYGGVGPYYFDCSGFTQYVFKHALNKNIPRNAQVQYDVATKVAPSQREPGDLVFFGSGPQGISHVGLYRGKNSAGQDIMTDAQLNGVESEKIYEPWWNYLVGYGEM